MSNRQRDYANNSDLTYIRGVTKSGQPSEFTNGLKVMPFENDAKHGGGTDVVVMLAQVNSYDGSVNGPFTPIPLHRAKKPLLSKNGNWAHSGTFKKLEAGDGSNRLFLTERDPDDNAFYVHVHTGLNCDRRGSVDGDLNKLILENPDDFKPAVPGSFSLYGGSQQAQKVSQAEGLVFGDQEAKRLKWSVAKTHAIIGGPLVRHDLWRIPVGAAVLVQDVTGIIFRIVNEGGELKLVDAAKYQQVFNDFETERRQTNQSARKESPQRRSRGGVILPDTGNGPVSESAAS